MEYTLLGQTGLRVSRIALGLWQAGGDWGAVNDAQEIATVHRALDLGVNFYDTAQAYGFGAAERLLGKALREAMRRDRDALVIATKGGLRRAGDRLVRDASPAWLRRGIEESLRWLGTDHVDLYQVHWPDHATPSAETAEALNAFVREGKTRYVGVSNFSAADMAELGRFGRVDTLQPPYSLFRRDVERDALPYAREHGIGVLVYGPLAHGLLGGRMTPATAFAPDDWRSRSPIFKGDAFVANLAAVGRLRTLAERAGHTVTDLAIAWVLANPAVHAAIVGAHSPAQIEGVVGAASLGLSHVDLRKIDRAMAGAKPITGPSPEMFAEDVTAPAARAR